MSFVKVPGKSTLVNVALVRKVESYCYKYLGNTAYHVQLWYNSGYRPDEDHEYDEYIFDNAEAQRDFLDAIRST